MTPAPRLIVLQESTEVIVGSHCPQRRGRVDAQLAVREEEGSVAIGLT